MEKTEKVMLLSGIILVGFFVAVVYHYTMGFYLGFQAPFNSFVCPAYKAFCDFIEVLPYVKDFAPYKTVTVWIAYFPLTYILMFPFTLIKNVIVSYLIFIAIFLGFFVPTNAKMFFSKSFSKLQNFQNIFIITFLSYPILYALDKGNFDLFLFIILAGFVYSFKNEKYILSAVLLALHNAMKPFPILFLFLFLFKKKYKEFFLSIILTTILVIGGFMVLKGNFFDQISVFIKDTCSMGSYYYNNDNIGLFFTSSFFYPLKWLLCKLGIHPVMNTIQFVQYYNIFMQIMAVLIVLFTWREKAFWKQITLLTLSMLMLPYLIYDHKLLFLFIPLWLFVNSNEKTKFDLAYTVLFGLLFIPKNFIIINPSAINHPDLLFLLTGGEYFIKHHVYWSEISLSTILNPLIMLLMFGLIVYEQFNKREKKSDEPLG